MKKRTKKQTRERLRKLFLNCLSCQFNCGLRYKDFDKRLNQLDEMAQAAFWKEFYSYFGSED